MRKKGKKWGNIRIILGKILSEKMGKYNNLFVSNFLCPYRCTGRPHFTLLMSNDVIVSWLVAGVWCIGLVWVETVGQ